MYHWEEKHSKLTAFIEFTVQLTNKSNKEVVCQTLKGSIMERNREEKRFIWEWDKATVLTQVVSRGHPKKVLFRKANVSEK